jgi:DNA-binding transcriptional MerR regulator
MRIGELSKVTEVPVPTIKYYLREDCCRGRAEQPEPGVIRRTPRPPAPLIRALVELAQVPVAQVKDILESLDSDDVPLHEQIGRAHRALTPTRKQTASEEARAAATTQVTDLITRRGWSVEPEAPALPP